MKLTKEQLKKIIQEEVANMEESAHGGFRGYTGPDDDEPESEEAYIRRMRRKQEFDRERFARAGTGISSAEMKAREKAAEEEAQYKKDQARRAKNLSNLEADKQEKKAHKDKIARAFINIGDANITKQVKRGNLGYWAKVAAKELDAPILNNYLDDPETLIQMMSQRDVKRFARKAGYNKKRSFMQKAGSFLTGKGFKEGITKEDIQKMVQEELDNIGEVKVGDYELDPGQGDMPDRFDIVNDLKNAMLAAGKKWVKMASKGQTPEAAEKFEIIYDMLENGLLKADQAAYDIMKEKKTTKGN